MATTPAFANVFHAPVISDAKDDGVAASKLVAKHSTPITLDNLENALSATKVASFAQGLALIQRASGWLVEDVDVSACARIWTRGCIIHADFLNDIASRYIAHTPNLMMIPFFTNLMGEG
jgi:6-phosphogluconate dehydrogenase